MTMENFSVSDQLLVLISVLNILFGFLLFKSARQKTNELKYFFFTVLAVSLWSSSRAVLDFVSLSYPDYINLTIISLYTSAALIPFFFLLFVSKFTSSRMDKFTVLLFSFFLALVLMFVVFPLKFINYIVLSNSEIKFIFDTKYYLWYAIYVTGTFVYAFLLLLDSIFQIKKRRKRIHLIYIFLSTLIPSVIGLWTNLILPYFGDFSYFSMGPISTVIMIFILGYAISFYNLWDFRYLSSMFFIIALNFLLLFNVYANLGSELRYVYLTTLFASLFFSYFLKKSIDNDFKHKKQLEDIANLLKEKNKELEYISRKKSEFLSIATHQLRAPTAVLRGQLSLILEGSYGKLPEYLKEPIKKAFDSSTRLAHTITDFLNVSRIEQGRMQYNFQDLDIVELVQDVYDELKERARERGLDFNLELCKKSSNTHVYADKEKLRHVIFNLVENAIKYTEKGFVNIKVCDKLKGRIRIVVEDSGMGLDKEDLRFLFDKFVRSKNVYGINVEGSGLGLYIAREIVYAHNGRIWAESEGLGKGSKFSVELPIYIPDQHNEEKDKN